MVHHRKPRLGQLLAEKPRSTPGERTVRLRASFSPTDVPQGGTPNKNAAGGDVRPGGNRRGTIHRAHAATPRIFVIRETHDTPMQVAERLQRAGGLNRYGQPNYRAVWGWNRLAWIGGKFEDRDAAGNLLREVVELRREPKYLAVNRWHIERWMPPEAYGSPRQWYAQSIERENGISIPALGPYPARGDYEHCLTLEDPQGNFVQLTPAAAEHIAHAIEYARKSPHAAGKRRLTDRQQHEEAAYDQWAYDVLDDAVPAFHKQPFVTVA